MPFAAGPRAVVTCVRHAEITGGGANPALSSAGQLRAALLAHMVQDEDVKAVYVTELTRSVQTGTPTAEAAGLSVTPYAATDTAGLRTAISGHRSGLVLVVAHSNTVGDIIAALGAPNIGDLQEDQFDRMFVLTRPAFGGPTLVRLRYGASTP